MEFHLLVSIGMCMYFFAIWMIEHAERLTPKILLRQLYSYLHDYIIITSYSSTRHSFPFSLGSVSTLSTCQDSLPTPVDT
jgi:hypothetical protein